MSKLNFKILKQRGNARVGEITLNGVTIQTPIFMPVGTKATIKGMILDLLRDPKYIGSHIEPIKLILANTFHLYLRPGRELIRDAGGLHAFENRKDGLILTDSGGFQVFSLGLSKRFSPGEGGSPKDRGVSFPHQVKIKLTEDGVKFSSPHDGSKHFFTPENVVDTQINFGSDIMMVLDVCSPGNADKGSVKRQMEMTHRRAKRAFDHFKPKYDQARGVLFPIVQGGSHLDLRSQSIETLSEYARDGIAIGGVSVGEDKEKVQEVVSYTASKLPSDKPRYLMGIGTPEDLLYGIEQGIDMFDCVSATRLGRHGIIFSDEGNIKITNAKYTRDFSPLTDNCDCYACKHLTKAYFHHLLREKEALGGILMGLHNIVYLNRILEDRKKNMLSK
ncbi:MAG: tRNA guanosine(34) transglycosylase Tgt [Candidatus Absconditabacteria bacterium]|nr:tRNA guanosine(34) transglycosylase Tgt [Candidatus Absconditabacteria bacterium]MDD3868559.1 tRNA guanosine(34) transglycosylase Tgt [Candidatus Absconditabacteria bacterium]MDD4714123.1 tRNA guanosine(34) transglycosylase Tgt [Candidatus Absconditabacteria bacterium]